MFTIFTLADIRCHTFAVLALQVAVRRTDVTVLMPDLLVPHVAGAVVRCRTLPMLTLVYTHRVAHSIGVQLVSISTYTRVTCWIIHKFI